MKRSSLLMLLVSWAMPLLAQADPIATVRYDYTKWSRSEPSRFLLLPQSAQLKGEKFEDQIRELFTLLVSNKRNSYGDARLAFKPDAAETGIVYVYLDESKAQYNPIVMAETVYTFTENGASKVIFPKAAPQGWTRADVPFNAYVLEMKMYEALPPSAASASNVVMPDGRRLPLAQVLEGIKAEKAEYSDPFWSYLQTGPSTAILRVIEASKALSLQSRSTRLLPMLESADVAIRTAAIGALEGLDQKEVNLALRKVMDQDPEQKVKDLAALQLSKSQDPAFAVAAQFHALRSQDESIAASAAKTLGQSKQQEANQHLKAALAHNSGLVRKAAAESLMLRNETSAIVDALKDPQFSANSNELAQVLAAQDKDRTSAEQGLIHLLAHGDHAQSMAAAQKLAAFKDANAQRALGKACLSENAELRIEAAKSLGAQKDPATLEILAQANVDDAESGDAVLTAMQQIYASQEIDFVMKGIRSKNNAQKRAAITAMGDLVRNQKGKWVKRDAQEVLRPLAQSKDPNIRAAVAQSFELMADKSLEPEMEALASDQAIEVKRAAAHSLRAFPGQSSVDHLLAYAKEDDPQLLANALGSLGALKERAALDLITSRLGHNDVRVRREATRALVQLGETLEQKQPLLSFFSDRMFDDDGEVRKLSIDGLLLVNDHRVQTALSALLQDPVIEVRQNALLAMAKSGDASAIEGIATALDDDAPSVRRTALEAFALLNSKEALPRLQAHLTKENDESLRHTTEQVIASLRK